MGRRLPSGMFTARMHALRAERKPAPPFGSDEWKAFVADAMAKPPSARTMAERKAIRRAMLERP